MTDEARRSRPSPAPPSLDGQWARLRVETPSILRRGGWYRVLSLTADQVTVSIDGKPIALGRDSLEIRNSPPRRWTVLRRPRRVIRAPENLRGGYMVCPSCRHRIALPRAGTRDCRCPRCNVVSDIGWDENYLSQAS